MIAAGKADDACLLYVVKGNSENLVNLPLTSEDSF